jgi:hypothetical protein
MLTQVMPSFKLCQWRRDLQALIEGCLVDEPTTPSQPASAKRARL